MKDRNVDASLCEARQLRPLVGTTDFSQAITSLALRRAKRLQTKRPHEFAMTIDRRYKSEKRFNSGE